MTKEMFEAFADSFGMLKEWKKHACDRQVWNAWSRSQEGRDALATFMGFDGLWRV